MSGESGHKNTDAAGGARRHIARGAGITFVGAVLGGALVMVNEILAARFLGVTAYGLYALARAMTRIGEIGSLFGLRIAVLHFLPLHSEAQRPDLAAGVIYAALLLPVAIGTTVAVIFGGFGEWLATALFAKPGVAVFLKVLVVAVPLMALAEVLGHIARGLGHTVPYVVSRNIVPPFIFMSLLIWLTVTDAEDVWAARGFVIAQFFGFLVACYTLFGVIEKRIWRARPVFRTGALYRYAFPIFVNTILYMVIAWTDLLMIGHYESAADVGIYRGCMQFTLVFEMMIQAFNAASAREFPVLVQKRDMTRLQDLYATVVRWSAMLAFVCLALLALNARDLLSLLGPDFLAGAGVLALLAVGGLCRVLGNSAAFVLIVGKRQFHETGNVVIAALLNVGLNLLLIPALGIVGAALATAATMVVLAALRIFRVGRTFGLRTPLVSILRVGVILSAAGLALWWLAGQAGFGPGSGFLVLLIRVTIMGIILMGLTWRFVATDEDRRLLGSLLRKGDSGVGESQ